MKLLLEDKTVDACEAILVASSEWLYLSLVTGFRLRDALAPEENGAVLRHL